MSIEIQLETEGIQQVEQMLSVLSTIGSKLGAIELHSRRREPYVDRDTGDVFGNEASNSTILRSLKAQGRDFITASSSDLDEIANSAANEAERILGSEFSKGAAIDKWTHQQRKADLKLKRDRSAGANPDPSKYFRGLDQFATDLSRALLEASMKTWMRQISRRIDKSETNNPPFNGKLSDEWYQQKISLTDGWAYPIGKLSGQLLDNLNPDGLGGRNIRLRKS
jgi:hypothetical protein